MAEEKVLLEEIVAGVKETCGNAPSLRGKKTVEKIAAILNVLPEVVKHVEVLGEKLESADKKELAIEACLKWANMSTLNDTIERQLLGLIIDFLISLLNKWLGKEWLSKVTGFLSTVWSFVKRLF